MRLDRPQRTIRLISFTAAVVLATSACASSTTSSPATSAVVPSGSSGESSTPTQATPLLLRAAYNAVPATWDPVKSFNREPMYFVNIYDSLLHMEPDGSIVPALATSFEHSGDGLIWTFHLREGVQFHDGEPLTADAVKRSIEAAKERSGASFIWAPLDVVETPDDLTVVLKLTYPAPMDIIETSRYGAWVVSPKALDAVAQDTNYFETGIDAGTGPYTVESFTPDQEIVLTKFDDYWGGWNGVHYDKIAVSLVPEATTQQQLLQGGQADIVENVPGTSLDAFKSDPNYTVDSYPTWRNVTMWINTQRPPLDNKLVRQALSYAIPYSDIIKVGPNGYATQSRGPAPVGLFPHDDKVFQYTYDLEKAKQLLADAGHPSGGFSVELTTTSQNGDQQRFAPLIKESFAAIGVDLKLTPMMYAQQLERAQGPAEQRQDLYTQVYAPTYADAGVDNMYAWFHCENPPYANFSYWCNPEYDSLIAEAAKLTGTDRPRAQELYSQAQGILLDEAPAAFLYDVQAVVVWPKAVAGFTYNANYPASLFLYPLHPAS
jgi:ABC-type transport system substrate-binding protein